MAETVENNIPKETPEEEAYIEQQYEKLKQTYLNSSHRKKIDIIERAFRFAKKAHSGVRRRSGEPYILHPIAVAQIVAEEIGLGSTSIASALLHDVVEDTDTTVEDIENLFTPKIAQIVDGLTKISGGVFGAKASAQAENFRKLILTMPEDIRVVLIKMADRLHNMRTLGSMPPAKQLKIAGETQYIYAPLANRLGLYRIKTELEDLSFKYEHPDDYKTLEKRLEETQRERDHLFSDIEGPIKQKLQDLGFKFEIESRVKSIYSIWRKMHTKSVQFEEIYDILAIRIIFEPKDLKEEKQNCWSIYSAITDLYKPHPDRIRDWVSTPKANGYEALHVTVMGPDGKWIEVQIRSRRMDDIAEKGFAAHWKYKTGEKDDSELEKWLQTIKELLENPEPNAIDFLDTFKMNLFANEIFVYTPKGEIKTMPQGTTVLDFAFNLHTDLGSHCIGAKVNHKLVALNEVLKSGDQVEILTSPRQMPRPDWIEIVKTAKAKEFLRKHFQKEYKNTRANGEKILDSFLQEIDEVKTPELVHHIMENYDEIRAEEFYYKVGNGTINLNELKKTMFKDKKDGKLFKIWKFAIDMVTSSSTKDKPAEADPNDKRKSIKVGKMADVQFRTADCCCPIPGDNILGYRDDDGVYIVHKRTCPVAQKLQANYGERIVTVNWQSEKELCYAVSIEIKGIDRQGVLLDIVKKISDMKANITRLSVETNNNNFMAVITVYIHNASDLNDLCMHISKIREVSSVVRLERNNSK